MRLTKHHGLGNDFLVVLDADPDPAVARALCDRHRGIGADGLLHLGAAPGGSGADVSMVLLNADGSRAEMSGNGIGCLVQAALLAGRATGPTVTVATDAGLRTVTVEPGEAPGVHLATVAMGTPVVGDDEVEWADGHWLVRAAQVDVGNPHLVAMSPNRGGATAEEVDRLGRAANEAFTGGVNVEVVGLDHAADDAADDDEDLGRRLVMEVYERGVGMTSACGTGAVAAAAAMHRWGAAEDDVLVRMPGGASRVRLTDDGTATITTPITYVAAIEWEGPA